MPGMPGVRFLPNAITVLALCSGLTSVAFALNGQWLLAVVAIAAAGILDSLDGPAARLLRSTSRIGAELDSLSDCISFGVAPALLMYVWLLSEEARGFGWMVCLLFAVCAALRLARFNSLLDDTPKPWAKGFFTGVPTPAGGLLVDRSAAAHGPARGRRALGEPVGRLALGGRHRPDDGVPDADDRAQVRPGAAAAHRAGAGAARAGRRGAVLRAGTGRSRRHVRVPAHIPYAVWKYNHLKNHPELWLPAERVRRRRTTRRIRLRMPRR